MKPVEISANGRVHLLADLAVPLALNRLAAGEGEWEVEIGFGKGRYLIRRAGENPERRFLGIERARAYYRIAAQRAARQGLFNLVLVKGEALFVISALLPRGFASRVHVYFPDPWPKARHQRRRLFDPETVDLTLGILQPGGQLHFATDHLAYGELVRELLTGHPRAQVERLPGVWPDGARTNYEHKYMQEGREIMRLRVTWGGASDTAALHPLGESLVVAATAARTTPTEPIG